MVTDKVINRVISFLDTDISYIAIGTGVAPSTNSTTLDAEILRKQADSLIDENTIIKEMYLDETEGNGVTYTNTGVFGNGATSLIGSGELFAGGAINIAKNNLQSLTVSIEITVEAVN